MSKLELAAVRLARSIGHRHGCNFRACSCGAVEETKDALTDFWREHKQMSEPPPGVIGMYLKGGGSHGE